MEMATIQLSKFPRITRVTTIYPTPNEKNKGEEYREYIMYIPENKDDEKFLEILNKKLERYKVN